MTETLATQQMGSRRTSRAGLPWYLLVVGGVASAFWVLYLRHRLIDDAYIYLSYARTLADYGQWGLVESLPSNTATSGLLVLLLGPLAAVLGSAPTAAGVLFVACNVFAAWALWRITAFVDAPTWVAWAGWSLLIFNPLLASTAGMESHLAIAGVLWLVDCAQRQRAVPAGVLLTALFMTRPELVLTGALLIALLERGARRLLVSAGVAAVTVLGWLLFSWIRLGSLVPDTLLIKKNIGSWGKWDYTNGLLLYFDRLPVATLLALAPALLGLVAWAYALAVLDKARLRTPLAIGAAGLAYFAVYSLLGVPPFHWYYSTPIALLTITLVLIAGLSSRSWPRWPIAVIAGLSVVFLGGTALQQSDPIAPISTNWATPGEYREMSPVMMRQIGSASVSSPGEVGTLAFYCNCPIVDEFTDIGVVNDALREQIETSTGLRRKALELNLAHRNLERTAIVPEYAMTWRPGFADENAGLDAQTAWKGPGHFVIEDHSTAGEGP